MWWAKLGLLVLWLIGLLNFAIDAYEGRSYDSYDSLFFMSISIAVSYAIKPAAAELLLLGRQDPLTRLVSDLSQGMLSLWPAPTAVGNAIYVLENFIRWPLVMRAWWKVLLFLVDGFENDSFRNGVIPQRPEFSHLLEVPAYLLDPLSSLGCAYLSMRLRSYVRATLAAAATSRRRAEPPATFTPSGRRMLAPAPAAVGNAAVDAEVRVLHANALASQAAYDTFVADFSHWARTGVARVTDVQTTAAKRPASKDDALRAARSKSPRPRKAKKDM